MQLLVRFTDYLNSSQNKLSNTTVKNYKADISNFINWYKKQFNQELGITPSNITSQIVDLYKSSKIQESNLSIKTLNRHLSSLRKFFQFLKNEGIINLDPFEQLKDLSKARLALQDKWHLQAFKNNLYLYNKSNLTIKNYIIDVRHFLEWIEQVTILPNEQTPKEKNIFGNINDSLVNEYKKRLLEHQFSPRTINRKLSSIRQYIKWIASEKLVGNSRFAEASRPDSRLDSADPRRTERLATRQAELESRKIWHQLRHYRPRYFHLAILIFFISQLGLLINQSIILKPQSQTSVLGILESIPPRILSFNGKLTDSSNIPITGNMAPLRMSIYNNETASGSSLLWQEVIDVTTDSEGKFSTSLGNNTPLSQSLFIENQALWLGVSIGSSSELIPREPIAGATLASNAEKLQGQSLITSPLADTKNVILALDSSGNLTIDGVASPTFQVTGGVFKLLGQTLVLSTTPGSNTNVEIEPMDLGKIDIKKPIFNSTDNNNIDDAIGAVEINDSLAILATTSAQSAFLINQNSTGKLISAYTSRTAKFEVDNNGNIITPTGSKWQPFSNSTSALNIANSSGNSFVTFDASNTRVGIGTTAPALKLDVQDSQSGTATAQIFNSSNGTDADGLIVKLGNTSSTVDRLNHFISFETSGIGIVGSISGSGAMGVEFRTNGIADFAEYIKKDTNQIIEYGSIVCINEKGLALPCDQTNNKIIGVASNHGGFTGGNDLGDGSIRVGFIGQIRTLVSSINGDIKPGDSLTSSSIPGIAVKANQTGPIVGKALESLSCHPEASAEGSHEILHSAQNDNVCQDKILVAISVSWYDPSEYNDKYNSTTENLPKSSIVSPITEIDKVHANIVSPIISDSINLSINKSSDLDNEETNIIGIATESAVAAKAALAKSDLALAGIDSQDAVSSSGSIDSKTLTSNTEDTPIFTQGLIAFGPTSLIDTSIVGQLSIGPQGGGFIITQNSINAIGAALELQSLRQGALSIMGGLVYIDTNGDIKVSANAMFANNVMIGGELIASGSATFNKINLSIEGGTLAISSKELIATGSAGTAFVRARETEITINNKLVTEKSLIYITPIGTPSGQTPFLLRQVPEQPTLSPSTSLLINSEDSFTVGIASPSAKNTPFNWLIIN